jgi:ADP-ribose pyrophosphatase YjhB (NUDIX family)
VCYLKLAEVGALTVKVRRSAGSLAIRRRNRAKQRKHIPETLWKRVLASIPIPCVDIIVHTTVKHRVCVLLGYRKIYPYRNYWALPGGRIIKRESLREAADRQIKEIGLRPTRDYRLVGVYPINFKRRSDVSICLSMRLVPRREARPTRELVSYMWRELNDLPARLGANYGRMLGDFKDKHYAVP